MKYIYIVSDIINTSQTPTERYCIAERIPCGTWAEAQKLAEEWNNANRY